MRTNKQLVFIFARKRNVDVSTARRILRFLGAKPTLSENPARWESYDSGLDSHGSNPWRTRRVSDDYRDCTADQCNLAKLAIGLIASGRRPCFKLANGGFITWDGAPEDAWETPCDVTWERTV
jgi:hypothetical protein